MNLLDCLYIPAAFLTAPWWARKTRGGWDERFGKITPLPAQRGRGGGGGKAEGGVPRIMLHAVSVGEVNALRSLVPMLAAQAEVVVSVTTDTGIARARQLWQSVETPNPVFVVRYPLDFSHAVARFLDAVRPDAVGLVELELWPNFLKACTRRNIPVGVINGRLSARSFKNYARFRPALRGMFSSLIFAAVQDDVYAERFRHMGVGGGGQGGKVVVTGSMKWDAAMIAKDIGPNAHNRAARLSEKAEKLANELVIDRTKPLVVAGSTGPLPEGSTHRGEESLIDAILTNVSADAQLLCAPRKPERFDEAFQSLGGDERCTRRSRRNNASPRSARFLLDTIGELAAAYELADIVVVGRSFGDLHGSDPIEPIALGKPVIIGPRYGDFQNIVETFQRAGGIVVLPDAREETLANTLKELLASDERRGELARRGVECVRANQGATKRHADLLLGLLRARASV